MPKPNTTLLIFILIIIVIVLVITQILVSRNQNGNGQNSPVNLPPVITSEDNSVKVTSTTINSQPLAVNTQLKFKFSKPIDAESLKLDVTPTEELFPLFNQSLTELTIGPTNAWDFGTEYKVKILKETKSSDGQTLDKDYEFTFKTIPYSGI